MTDAKKRRRTSRALLKFPFTFVFQFGAPGIFVSKRNQLPRPVFQRALQDIGILVASEHAEITGLLAMPAIDACFHFNRSRSKGKSGRSFLSLRVRFGFNLDFHRRLACPANGTT